MSRRRALHLAVAVVIFAVVTVGLLPTINWIERVRSPGGYSRWAMSGTWVPGLLTAGVYLLAVWIGHHLRRRKLHRT